MTKPSLHSRRRFVVKITICAAMLFVVITLYSIFVKFVVSFMVVAGFSFPRFVEEPLQLLVLTSKKSPGVSRRVALQLSNCSAPTRQKIILLLQFGTVRERLGATLVLIESARNVPNSIPSLRNTLYADVKNNLQLGDPALEVVSSHLLWLLDKDTKQALHHLARIYDEAEEDNADCLEFVLYALFDIAQSSPANLQECRREFAKRNERAQRRWAHVQSILP